MKKLIVLAVLSAFVLASCTKFEEGPKVTLKTNKMRLCKEWKVESITYLSLGNITVTPAVSDIYKFEKDNTYEISDSTGASTGTWSIINGEKIKLVSDGAIAFPLEFTIKKLYSKELWAVDNTWNIEYHMVPN